MDTLDNIDTDLILEFYVELSTSKLDTHITTKIKKALTKMSFPVLFDWQFCYQSIDPTDKLSDGEQEDGNVWSCKL